MDALVAAIFLWLAANFDLPANYSPPQIEIVPRMEIAFLRYGAFSPEARREITSRYLSANSSGKGREVVAIYDPARKTILLDGWTGRTPAELSVLVHELVHHLQYSADLKYEFLQAPRAQTLKRRRA